MRPALSPPFRLTRCLFAALALLAPRALAAPQKALSPAAAPFELYESWPIETALDDPDLRDAHLVWLERIEAAERSLDLAHFYASDREGSRLAPILAALEAAAERGVRVRFLLSERFRETYPATWKRLAAHRGIEVRFLDLGPGVLHAKYFIVDGAEVLLGSQNFDWRSLTHIVELGARVRSPRVAAAFARIFAADWALAGGEREAHARLGGAPAAETVALKSPYGPVEVRAVFSPRGRLPSTRDWDLPRLVERIDAARERVRVQLLTYATTDREGRYFDTLESALRRAAARGVQVELLLANWCKRRWTIEGLQSLQALPRVEVRLVTIPPAEEGFIPYARVIHSKFLAVDGEHGWLGTGNWNRGTFHDTRNVGLLLDGRGTVAILDRLFERLWSSPYAEVVDPCAAYEPPRVGD